MPEQFDGSQASSIVEQDLQPNLKNDSPKLRAMGFGELLDAVFSLYRAHFWSFLGIVSGYFIVMLIGVSIFFLDDGLGRGAKIIIWVPAIITIFGISVLVISALIFAVAEVYLGKPIRTRVVLGQAVRLFWRCFVGSLILGLVGGLLLVCLLIIFAFLGRVFPRSFVEDNLWLTTAFPLSYLLIAACITVLFVGYWCFYILATYMEAVSVWDGLKRCGGLIKGRRWRIIGIVIAIFLIAFVIGVILRATFAFPLTFTGFKGIGNFLENIQWMVLWMLPTTRTGLRISYALMYLINLGVDTFVMPIWVIGFVLLYFDQRIRKEGFDIEMMVARQGE
ncbi:hypothetical protein C6499_12015 [Candidatus Poribacteria bacterium]|nr:MAG: hypothetical protein C6499_12015 [Candidatus Poribacteria bacterium]